MGNSTGPTRVRILASPRYLVIGVEARDPDPQGIVSTSKARDPELRAEDYIKIVLDPFLDGRTGYIFALNPGGARYDALVARRGEGEDPQWDAVWEAATARRSRGMVGGDPNTSPEPDLRRHTGSLGIQR